MKHTKIDIVRARWTTVRWNKNKQDVLDAGDSLCTALAALQPQNAKLEEEIATLKRVIENHDKAVDDGHYCNYLQKEVNVLLTDTQDNDALLEGGDDVEIS